MLSMGLQPVGFLTIALSTCQLSNGNLETRLREEKLKQEQREAEVETARQTFSAKAKDMVSAAGIDPSLESALVERDAGVTHPFSFLVGSEPV